ncbi:MAG: beta-lactamase family protein [Colwellia sp.]|nr:beta-lactamase family protein [Colwellia sp.]
MKSYSLLFLQVLLFLLSLMQPVYSEEVTTSERQVFLPQLLSLFNQGDRHEVMHFYTANINPEQIGMYGIKAHVSGLLNDQTTHGKLRLIKYLPNDGDNERAEVIAENSQFPYILTVNRTSKAPYKINYFYLVDKEVAQNNKKINLTEFKTELNSFVLRLVSKEAFSGTILVAQGEQIIFQQAVGQSNKSDNIANNLETKFSVASMNKMFTAVAILQLIEQGKLNFEDKLIKYVESGWLPQEGAEKITIRQLLTHTSGMGNIFTEAFLMSDKGNYRELASYKQLIAETPLLFSPGTSNRYSNSGMHMLGLVIEKVSGQDYYDYIEQHVYQKANMPNSNSYELDGITSNLAIGYLKKAHSDTWVNNHYTNGVKGGPGGGGYSTIGDLHNFSQALTQFSLLSREMTEQAYSNKTEFNSPAWYGYGFIVSGEAGNRVVGHGGATLGVDARLDIHLDTGIVVAILANQNGVVAPVLRKINSLIAQLPQEAD